MITNIEVLLNTRSQLGLHEGFHVISTKIQGIGSNLRPRAFLYRSGKVIFSNLQSYC